MKKMKISHYLWILVFLPIFILSGMFYLGQSSLASVGNFMDKLYRHPYAVSSSIKDIKGGILELQCLNLEDDQSLLNSRKVENIDRNIEKSIEVLKTSYLGEREHVLKLESKYKMWIDTLFERKSSSTDADKKNLHYNDLLANVESINMYADSKGKDFYLKASAYRNQATSIFIYTVIGSIIILIFASSLISKRLNSEVFAIMLKLKRGGEVVLNESNEITKSSKTLSDGTNDSASALQESASSMEELSAMVKNNVLQAQKSKDLSQEMEESAKLVCEKTTELIGSMDRISESNQDIASLVFAIEEIAEKTKIIDDIVFQTKILSFNASVEAERAGEFGRGFSVVAQEVSNLAKMSGRASTEIAVIVKNSVKNAQVIYESNKSRVENGTFLVNDTASFIKKIEDDSKNIRQNVEQILSASQDQAAGISQMNEAISQLDQTTQLNASMATQSSNASFELNQQALNLQSIVKELEFLVKGQSRDQDGETKNDQVSGGKVLLLQNRKNEKSEDKRNEEIKKIANGANSWDKI